MKHRAACCIAVALPFLALQLSHAQDKFRPIIDVRFDAPYRQIESSLGDEWAPTWGQDDALYSANDDGSNFGGVVDPNNPIAFGKLMGSHPDRMQGITISGMEDFREPTVFGPEVAGWQTLETSLIDGVRYRFTGCTADHSDRSCLLSSTDGGKTWTNVTPVGQSLAHGARFNAPSFISYGQMELLYGGEPGEYVYAASFSGIAGGQDSYIVGRVGAAKLARSGPADWTFQRDDGSFGPIEQAGMLPNTSDLGPDGANWKAMNTYAVDGVLYMFVTRCFYPWKSEDPEHRHWWRNASIIKSTDGGKTWTHAAKNNYEHPMFPGHRFATPYFVWYGKDGAASVDNADQYVYAVSNNGFFENGDDYILGRVPRSKLPALSAGDWSFYTGGDGMREAGWTSSLAAAKPILVNPRQLGMTGMTYIPALGRYVIVAWHYHKANFEQAVKDKDLGTVLEFFEAPRPWGPWTNVKSFDTGRLGWYTPIIGQRFQKTVDPATVSVVLYATGYTAKPEGGLDPVRYKLNYMPITLSTQPLPHNDPAFVGGR